MSVDRVLVDTSVWIEFFRGGAAGVVDRLDGLIKGGVVFTAGIVLAELLQGARSDREVGVIEDMRESFPVLVEDTTAWIRAGKLSRELRRSGKMVHLADCLIAILAADNACRVASLDVHFKAIAAVLPLERIEF
jgi:tRNA(fMet)-specific endonuclease VapC